MLRPYIAPSWATNQSQVRGALVEDLRPSPAIKYRAKRLPNRYTCRRHYFTQPLQLYPPISFIR